MSISKLWVSDLDINSKQILIKDYTKLLIDEGIYSDSEISNFIKDLENDKLCNIIDVLGKDYMLKLTFT